MGRGASTYATRRTSSLGRLMHGSVYHAARSWMIRCVPTMLWSLRRRFAQLPRGPRSAGTEQDPDHRGVAPNPAPELAPLHEALERQERRLEPKLAMRLPTKLVAGTQDVNRRRGSSQMKLRRLWLAGTPNPLDPLTSDDHAHQLLCWLRSESLFSGSVIPASDLKAVYPAFCRSIGASAKPWQSVASSLRLLTGGKRRYARVNGRNVSVYRISKS
jgi:hypothetical protein